MSQFFNQFSYLLFAIAIAALAFLVLRSRVRRGVLLAVLVGVSVVFVGIWLALRTGEGDARDVANYESVIANGRPTFIEFFSNFCTACLVARPVVDGIVVEISPEFNILRVNIHSEDGMAMREAYGFSYTPEFVLLDTAGVEVWRSHTPPTTEVLDTAREN